MCSCVPYLAHSGQQPVIEGWRFAQLARSRKDLDNMELKLEPARTCLPTVKFSQIKGVSWWIYPCVTSFFCSIEALFRTDYYKSCSHKDQIPFLCQFTLPGHKCLLCSLGVKKLCSRSETLPSGLLLTHHPLDLRSFRQRFRSANYPQFYSVSLCKLVSVFVCCWPLFCWVDYGHANHSGITTNLCP